MKDGDLNELLAKLRRSLDTSHQAQTDMLELVQRLVQDRTPAVVVHEIDADTDPDAGPYTRQNLVRSGRSTISVEEAAKYLGIGRGAASLAVKNGELPSLRVGSRILMPVAALLETLTGRRAQHADLTR